MRFLIVVFAFLLAGRDKPIGCGEIIRKGEKYKLMGSAPRFPVERP